MNPIETLLSDYPKSLVESKNCEGSLNNLQIVFLLLRHSQKEVKTQNFFNKRVIEILYKNNDKIYVEENKSKKKEQLEASKTFDVEKYQIRGWDDPEICQKASVIKEKLNKILSITNQLATPGPLTDEDFSILKSFAEENDIELPIRKQMESDIFILKAFTNNCLKAVLHIRDTFIKETFSERQDLLINKIVKSLKKRKNKIFVCVGESHVRTTNNPKYNQDAIKLKKAITEFSYLIFNCHLEPKVLYNILTVPTSSQELNFLSHLIARIKNLVNTNANTQVERITNFVSTLFSYSFLSYNPISYIQSTCFRNGFS